MIASSRSDALVQNFVGQWLQVRDIDGIAINEQAVMVREDAELTKLLEQREMRKTISPAVLHSGHCGFASRAR